MLATVLYKHGGVGGMGAYFVKLRTIRYFFAGTPAKEKSTTYSIFFISVRFKTG